MFREFLKERYKLLISEIKRTNKDIKVAFHRDGYITPIISNLIEVGVDILNPVQPKCMNPAEIKEKLSKDLCFIGTIDEQETLHFGTVDDLKKDILKRITKVGYNGGLILRPTHNVYSGAHRTLILENNGHQKLIHRSKEKIVKIPLSGNRMDRSMG